MWLIMADLHSRESYLSGVRDKSGQARHSTPAPSRSPRNRRQGQKRIALTTDSLCHSLYNNITTSAPFPHSCFEMSSTQNRRSFSGKNPKPMTHSRSSSSTTSFQIVTSSDSSPSTSPASDMPPRTNGTVNGVSEEMASAHLNGTENSRRPLDRKQSAPMMPAFMVSAPGKVIVFGEHAVVHGKVG